MRIITQILAFIFIISYLTTPSAAQIEFLPLGNRWAVVIGISKYKDSSRNLRFAKNDAISFKEVLLSKCRFQEDHILFLIDKDATREAIRRSIESWLSSKIRLNDLVVIYFSGHGTQAKDRDGDEEDGFDEYLVPHDFKNGDMSSGICDDIFAYWIANLISNKILIIFDCCFSGGAAKVKGFYRSGVKGDVHTDDFVKDISREIPRRGVALLAASKPDQVSFEDDSLKNGVFTYYIIEGITDKNSDMNFDRIISDNEVFYFVRDKVPKYTSTKFGKIQEPIFIDLIDDEIDLVYLPIEPTREKQSEEIKNLLYRLSRTHNYSKEIELCEQIISMDPENIKAHVHLAKLYERATENDKALYEWDIVLTILSRKGWKLTHPNPYLSVGNIYYKKGEYDKAISWYGKDETKYKNYQTNNAIGKAKVQLDRTEEAIHYFLKSININLRQVDAYLNLFKIYWGQASYDLAHDIIKKGVEINPDHYEIMYWYGLISKHYKKDMKLGENLLKRHFEESGVENELSDINKIKEQCRRGADVSYQVGDVVYKGKEIIEYLLSRSIQEFPYYADFYYMLGKYYIEEKRDKEAAEKKFKEFVKLNPFSEKKKEAQGYFKR